MFNSMSFRAAFSSVINSDFVYFDNAATAQKPDCMVKALSDYYGSALGSAGRGQNPLSEKASAAYAAARRSVMRFIGAAKPSEIIFTTGATDSLNMLAASYRRRLTKKAISSSPPSSIMQIISRGKTPAKKQAPSFA